MDEKERERQIAKREEQKAVLSAEQEKLRAGEDVEPEPKYKPGFWKGRPLRGLSPDEGKQALAEIWEDE